MAVSETLSRRGIVNACHRFCVPSVSIEGWSEPGLMKTTKAFERSLEGLEVLAPRYRQTWALESDNSFSIEKSRGLNPCSKTISTSPYFMPDWKAYLI